ncbi:NAD(P)-dependent alcohol dehydrogenase [Streptomyces sedi]|nr:NAD(P)-dependent alcohol dehydrogenase [Streptomyces sedi]
MNEMPNATMRAVRYDRYGPPEVLKVAHVPMPKPGPGQVLVKVHASSVNPVEAQVRAGKMRPMSGLRPPKGIGQDFAGEVVAAGPKADDGLVGSRVWGTTFALGAANTAEYITVRESLVASVPSGLDLVNAAALPTVGLTALVALDAANVQRGQRLLIVGAAGGIGSALIQIAHAKGVEVATVSSGDNLAFCSDLGAKETYDYARLVALERSDTFHAVVDLHGAHLGAYRSRLRPGGRIVTLAAKGMGYAMLSLLLPGPRVRLARARPKKELLVELAKLVETGDLRPVVENVYPLERIAEAHRAVESGHSRGKRVIQVVGDVES